jgi:ubiquinone/menaquinone biosynthesis C-methylase UbiE
MLEQARRLSDASQLRNILLLRGDATHLPWVDQQFDLVVCRLALHQVSDPAAVVSEMVRVTRPGGRVAVTDMVSDPTPGIADEINRLERLRDPSHGRTQSEAEVVPVVEASGAMIERSSVQDQPLDLED